MSNLRQKIQKWWIWILVLLPFLSFQLIMLFAPASTTVHLRKNEWSCHYATFLFHREEPQVILELSSARGSRAPEIGAIHSISLQDQATTGSTYAYRNINVKGISNHYVWTQHPKDGVIGRSISDLTATLNTNELLEKHFPIRGMIETIQVDGLTNQLRIYTLDGHQYAWMPGSSAPRKLSTQPPALQPSHRSSGRTSFGGTFPIPKHIGDTFLNEASPLYDIQLQKMMLLDNGDYLAQFKSLKGSAGNLQIARIDQNHHFVWRQDEDNFVSSPSEKCRQLCLSALHGNTLYLVLQDYQGENNIYLVAIDVESGDKQWELELG